MAAVLGLAPDMEGVRKPLEASKDSCCPADILTEHLPEYGSTLRQAAPLNLPGPGYEDEKCMELE